MKRHIPDLHTDFIYSVVAEEYGLWMTLIIIGIFGFIVVRGLLKAMAMQDPFRQIAACGLYIMLGMQVLINVSVNLGLIPPKGMTLPFISYGGSSMLAMGLCLGFILALTRKRNDEIVVNDDPSHW
jgi:cell division protein FtsW